MKHAVKTTLGAYRVINCDGTHVVMSNEEFPDIAEISRMLKSDLQRLGKESVTLHRKISDDSEMISSLQSKLATVEETAKEISRKKDDLEKSFAAIKKEYENLKDDLAHAESLNMNLRRICRERANQARDLPKSSDGYVVLVSQEWREKAQNGQLIRGYKTQIQSPHDASMDDETAKRQIFDDLIEGVLADISPEINMVEIAKTRMMSEYIEHFNLKDELTRTGSHLYRVAQKTIAIPELLEQILKEYANGQSHVNMELRSSTRLAWLLRKLVQNIVIGMWVMALLISSSIICTTTLKPRVFGMPFLGFAGYAIAIGIVLYLVTRHFITRPR